MPAAPCSERSTPRSCAASGCGMPATSRTLAADNSYDHHVC
jgi:hypothetical protein